MELKYNYTYVPPKDSDRSWKIEDVRDGRGMGAYTIVPLTEGQIISDSHYLIDNFSIAITELGRFHNHSENPTSKALKLKTKYSIVACRDMDIGEEITVNYADYSETVNIEKPKKDWKKGE